MFAASILAITACDILCSVDRSGSMRMEHPLTASNDNFSSNKHHQNHDQHQKHQTNVKDIASQNLSQSSKSHDDDCCKDVTNQFYKSLFNGDDLNIAKASAQNYILLILVKNYHLLTSVHYQNPFRVVFKAPPNSTGNYLRILIGSFLI